jgi:adenylate kinase
MILAISGTPGTGKSTVAAHVGKKLGWPVYDLNKIAHERNLYSGYDEKRKTHVVDLGKIQKALKNIESPDMIIESHYAHDMDCDAVIILRASPEEIRKRALEKGWTKEKTEENVLAEIMDVCLQEAMSTGRRIIEIDTTNKTPVKVAGEAIKALERIGLKRKE